jgi:hypothetical protein
MFSKPAIWIICDMQLSLHDFSPIFEVFQLVPWILRLCACWRLNSRFDTSWIRIKERNNFIVAIMFFDEFFDFSLNTWNFGDGKNGRPFIFVLIKQCFYHKLDIRIRSFWKNIDWCIYDLVKKVLNIVSIKRLLEGDELVYNDAHCPNVSLGIIWSVLTYLRWHEIWRTTFGFRHVFFIGQLLGDTKVSKLENTFFNENVLCLDISMQNSLGMKSQKT